MFTAGEGAQTASAINHGRNSSNHDQRQPRRITVESFSNTQNVDKSETDKGILPSGSRETTPKTDTIQPTEYTDEKGFFSGNSYVEMTKGIIHFYKRK